jgi:hypothetical protein
MKNAIFAALYTLGLSAFLPLLIVNHKSGAVLPMFFAPIIAAAFAEVLARTIRLTRERTESRIIWLIAAFIILSQTFRYTLGLDATDGFTEYLALNALYQIVLALIFAASERRTAKQAEIGHGHLV